MKKKKNIKGITIVSYIILSLFGLIVILPFWLLFVSSVTAETALAADGYRFIPTKFSLAAFRYIANQAATIFRAYGTTIVITVLGTFINLTLTTLMAYPLSRKDLPFRNLLMFLVLFTMLFKGGIIPQYLIYTQIFNMKNTYLALLVPNLLMSGFYIIMVRSYFSNSIPTELLESATIDGASEMKIFLKIMLPLSKPILASVGLFTAIYYWNDYSNGLYYITRPKYYSLQTLLNRIMSDVQYLAENSDTVAGMNVELPASTIKLAISVIAILPLLIAFPFFQQFFVKGITAGAVKG